MDDFVSSLCIFIASHISNPKRFQYLMECLESLINQTLQISIYLSISFNSDELKQDFLNNSRLQYLCSKINTIIREQKTPQMRHLCLLYPKLAEKHKWIMFCDDDDTYEPGRVEKIAKCIFQGNIECSQMDNKNVKRLAGLYESTFGKDHRQHRHEYWCYCVNIVLIENFYNRLKDHPDIIDNKCCDVLFAEYLRRVLPDYLYCRMEDKFYNYRVEDNSDSITGFIKENQNKYTRLDSPPTIMDLSFSEYVVNLNEYLHENIDVYLHDVFLRTIVGCELEYILNAEFRGDYALFPYVDNCHLEKIKQSHEYLREVCNKLFDIGFSNS
jgi:glycosyltransferase involved in cell wall biosynthesis